MKKIILVSGPIIIENNEVLLNIHGDTAFWKFCGGKVEDMDHRLFEHAQRELQEEMGAQCEQLNPEPFFVYTTKTDETTGKTSDVILVHFLAKRVGEITPGDDIREWAWHPLDSLPDNLAPNILPTLRHFGFIA